ncbi:MAG: hypothetical protein DCC63_18785 [Nitrospira sp.]|nr:MAG: hypothetical protein DCC63_18785 [Nitrospira sp.]
MDGDPNDFDWLRRLHCDFAEFLPNREIKSAEVLVLCKNNPKAQQSVVRNIRDADIFVLDLFEDYHKTLEALKAIAPDASRPLASLADTGCLSREELMKFLAAGRRMALIMISFTQSETNRLSELRMVSAAG